VAAINIAINAMLVTLSKFFIVNFPYCLVSSLQRLTYPLYISTF
jgi:hypothetical protein